MTFLVNWIAPYNVRCSSTHGGNHVPTSWHWVHRAIDVYGTADEMEKLARASVHSHRLFKEVFYDPLGRFVKNGTVHLGAIGGHSDHVHLAA